MEVNCRKDSDWKDSKVSIKDHSKWEITVIQLCTRILEYMKHFIVGGKDCVLNLQENVYEVRNSEIASRESWRRPKLDKDIHDFVQYTVEPKDMNWAP